MGPRRRVWEVRVLVVNRFRVGETADDAEPPADFAGRAGEALRAFAGCAGFVDGQLGRAADDPACWCLVTRWESVGAYRRALGSFAVKVAATPLLAEAVEEPSAYETLAYTESGQVRTGSSDRAPGAAGR